MNADQGNGSNYVWGRASLKERSAVIRSIVGEEEEFQEKPVSARLSDLAEQAVADCREFVLRGGLLNMDSWLGIIGENPRVCTACLAGAWLTISHPGQTLEKMTLAGGSSNLSLPQSRTMHALDLLRIGLVRDAFVAWQRTGHSDQAAEVTPEVVDSIDKKFRALMNLEALDGFVNLEELAVLRPVIEGLKEIESYVDGLA